MLLVMFQGRFKGKTFPATSEETLEWFSLLFSTALFMKVKSQLILEWFLHFWQQKPLVTTGSGCFFLIWLFISSLLAKVIEHWGQLTRCPVVPQRLTWRWKWVEYLIQTPHLGHCFRTLSITLSGLGDVNSSTLWNEMNSVLGPGLLYSHYL